MKYPRPELIPYALKIESEYGAKRIIKSSTAGGVPKASTGITLFGPKALDTP